MSAGDTTENLLSGGNSKEGFISHVFNFDEDSKLEMMNIVQYTLVGLVPIILLNKTMQKYVPEADDEKGSAELLAEICVQLVVMFLGILITHRAVTFVPTYSTVKYEKVSIVQIVLAMLMITLSLQTKLGEKVSILFDRVTELITGKSREGLEMKEEDAAKAKAKLQQAQGALSSSPGSGVDGFTLPQHTNPQQGGTTSIDSLPSQGMQNIRASPNEGAGLLDGGGVEAFAGF